MKNPCILRQMEKDIQRIYPPITSYIFNLSVLIDFFKITHSLNSHFFPKKIVITVVKIRSTRSGFWHGWFLVRALVLPVDSHLLAFSSYGRGGGLGGWRTGGENMFSGTSWNKDNNPNEGPHPHYLV